MSVKIGHARGGDPTYTPGDQTGNEVKVAYWYNHPWNFVARFKNRAKGERAAKFCEAACANQHIGYGQGDRNTLRPLAKAANWDAAKITKDCNCDCTSFVSVCAEAGGVNMDSAYTWGNAPYSENIRQKLAATGEFEILTDKKYLTSDAYLLRSDILVNEPLASGHAVMVLSNGALSGAETGTTTTPATAADPAVAKPAATATAATKEIKATEYAHCFDKALDGTYTCTASVLNIRNGAGETKKVLTQIVRGTTVRCWGFYNVVDGVNWLYIQFTQGNTQYTAFASAAYLKKK